MQECQLATRICRPGATPYGHKDGTSKVHDLPDIIGREA